MNKTQQELLDFRNHIKNFDKKFNLNDNIEICYLEKYNDLRIKDLEPVDTFVNPNTGITHVVTITFSFQIDEELNKCIIQENIFCKHGQDLLQSTTYHRHATESSYWEEDCPDTLLDILTIDQVNDIVHTIDHVDYLQQELLIPDLEEDTDIPF